MTGAPLILPSPSMRRNDERFMEAAIAYAVRGLGLSAPNPSVAALVVRYDGDQPIVIGRGVTAPGGRPHAEPQALAQAGDAARGATLYVTLEPCARRSTSGQQGSCADAIIVAGIARVVIGAEDPSSFAAGEGIKRLKDAGIHVVHGVQAVAARRMVMGHTLRVRENRPHVSLKMAQTADGFAGALGSKPIAITGPVAFSHTHLARAQADALMVGIGTVLADDPKLNCRLAGLESRSPTRVVLDSQLRMPPTSYLVRTAHQQPTWIFCSQTAASERAAILRQGGVEITPVSGHGGRLDLTEVLAVLALRGVTRLMAEGGPCLADALAMAGLVDELTLMTGPTSIGMGVPCIGPALRSWMQQASLLSDMFWGADRAEIFERKY